LTEPAGNGISVPLAAEKAVGCELAGEFGVDP
jgi:hypothetical protein